MNTRLFSIRALEALITLCTTYLALYSFFSSSIYDFISRMVKWILEEMGFILETNLDASKYMPILLSLLVLVVIFYEFVLGDEENTVNIYQVNFMLFLPEALSFSKLNWFSLLNAGYLLQPRRDYFQVFFTGVVIMTGYMILTFTTQHRASMREYVDHGVDVVQLRDVVESQAIFSFIIGVVSATVILVTSLLVPVFQNVLQRYLGGIPYPYLVFGVVSSIGLVFWTLFTIQKNGKI